MILALKLGRTLEELGRSMTSHEFTLWLEMFRLDQWGELRADERAGIVAATVANYAGMMRTKDAPAATPADFMPHLPAREVEPEPEPDPLEFFNAVKAAKLQGR